MDAPAFVWSPSPPELRLGPGEAHVWCAALDVGRRRTEALWRTLSDDERTRAERFYQEEDKARFIVARGLLREILGRLLGGVAPSALSFHRGPQGKPSLASPTRPDLRFNVAHSRGVALYALRRGVEVGVDVEQIRFDLDTDEIAEGALTAREKSALAALPPEARDEAFFVAWTRKEAYLKALGEGLGASPAETDLPDDGEWTFETLRPAPGYVGAFATVGSVRVYCWRED